MKDNHGQPHNTGFRAAARADRETDELIGLCKGIVSDGSVNTAEAEFLAKWLRMNSETTQEWPANVLYPRLKAMLVDGELNPKEEGELLSLLLGVSGGDAGRLNAHSLTTGLPLNVPLPEVVVADRWFCFTGKFLSGTRAQCHAAVASRGGMPTETITMNLNYLVIGVIGSRDWIHSTFGRKIQKAVEYRDSGFPLAIISEEHFLKALTII